MSILLGQCSLDESVSLEQGNDEYGPKPAKLISESVWQRRRRAAIFDKGLSTGTGTGTDSIFSKEKPIDNDGFLVVESMRSNISYIHQVHQRNNEINLDDSNEWIKFS